MSKHLLNKMVKFLTLNQGYWRKKKHTWWKT